MESSINHPPALALSRLSEQSDALHNGLQIPSDLLVNGLEKVRKLESSWKDAQSFSSLLRTSGRWMLLGDTVVLLVTLIAGYFATGLPEVITIHTLKEPLFFMAIGAASLLWLSIKGHYRHRLPFWQTISHILQIVVVGCLAGIVGGLLSNQSFPVGWFCLDWTLFVALVSCMRSMVRRWLIAHGKWEIPSLLVGNGPAAKMALDALQREPEMGFRVIGQVTLASYGTHKGSNAWKYLLTLYGASHILLAPEPAEFDKYNSAVKAMVRERVPFSMIPPWPGLLPTGTLSPHHSLMNDVLLFHDSDGLYSPLSRFLKRSFDMIVSVAALLFLLPLFVIVAFTVRKDGGPAFFKQARVGKGGTVFQCYKFRSMRVDAEKFFEAYLAENPEMAKEWGQFQKLKHDVRISKIGHIIRKTSIDELPQLLNVLKGDMSIVGPRPIIQSQQEFYGDDFAYYERVRPGITGPWQVSGRNRLTFAERVRLECSYVRNWSLWMDFVILLKTIPALLEKDSVF